MVSQKEIMAMKVAELRETCEDLGLSKSGLKKILQKRLLEHVESVSSIQSSTSEIVEEAEEEDPQAAEAPEAEPKTEAEKIQERKNKFGTESKEDKLVKRKERFQMVDDSSEENKKKLNARLARFGKIPVGVDPVELMTDEKKRKRMERFGTKEVKSPEYRLAKRQKRFAKETVETPASDVELNEKAEARKARFGLGQSKEQLEKRRARFGL